MQPLFTVLSRLHVQLYIYVRKPDLHSAAALNLAVPPSRLETEEKRRLPPHLWHRTVKQQLTIQSYVSILHWFIHSFNTKICVTPFKIYSQGAACANLNELNVNTINQSLEHEHSSDSRLLEESPMAESVSTDSHWELMVITWFKVPSHRNVKGEDRRGNDDIMPAPHRWLQKALLRLPFGTGSENENIRSSRQVVE